MTAILEWLFKYRPILYERGTIDFHPLWPSWITVILIIAALWGSYLLYRRLTASLAGFWRYGLTALRASAFLLILFIFMQPVLQIHSVVPQQNFVAIAYDFSKSMEIKDGDDGQSRLEVEKQILRPDDNPVLEALESKYKLRYFRFSGSAERSGSFPGELRRGNITDIENSLSQISEELSTVPLAGIVLITDGADNRSNDLPGLLSRFRARGIPIYSVGIGSEHFARDVEIVRVTAPGTVLKGTVVEAEVAIRSSGYPGQSAILTVTDQGNRLESREIVLGRNGEVKIFKVKLSGPLAGPRVFDFSLDPLPGENVVQNNKRSVMVRFQDDQPKILYIEGEPRWEHGSLRRAVQADENLHLVSMVRQAEGNFLYQGVESPGDLDAGFPVDREELFRYRGLILGSVESSFFTLDQQRMISDFVSRRGGGFIMLGGRSAYAQGGYAETPIEDMLPLRLTGTGGAAPEFYNLEFKVRLTDYGEQHPVCRLSLQEDLNRKRWEEAPALRGFSATAGPKPGATVLARGIVPENRNLNPVILAFQRFGRGRAVSFTAASSWLWRMEQDYEDNFHALFWRQMLRWLVTDVPDPVNISVRNRTYSPDETAVFQIEANDAAFMPLNNVRVSTYVEAPSGQRTTVPMDWESEQDGNYSGTFKPSEEGIHRVYSEVFRGNESLGSAETQFRVSESAEEFHQASMNSGLLRRLSQETGGRYYPADDLSTLADDISYTETGVSRLEEKDLWDMPFLFLLLIGLISTEWILRKRKGLS